MAISYYMDEQIPFAITEQLRQRGVDVLTAQDDQRRESSDSDLLDRASGLDRVFVTQDADLLVEGSLRQRARLSFVGVIYAAQTRVTIGQCVDELELIAKVSQLGEWANRVEYRPLK